MISERTFAKSFNGFWRELLPLLTPSFVHFFNEIYKTSLAGLGRNEEESDVSEEVDSSFVAEVAFNLAKLATENNVTVSAACEDQDLVHSAQLTASATVSTYEGEDSYPLPQSLNQEENRDVFALAANYDIFMIRIANKQPMKFHPKIRGAGFIASCEADLAAGTTLYEIKTVQRNIASKDIRQILIYLALQAATGERPWSRAGFFNPRRATVHEFDIEDFLSRISGGRPAGEVFQDIVAFATMRELELDTAF